MPEINQKGNETIRPGSGEHRDDPERSTDVRFGQLCAFQTPGMAAVTIQTRWRAVRLGREVRGQANAAGWHAIRHPDRDSRCKPIGYVRYRSDGRDTVSGRKTEHILRAPAEIPPPTAKDYGFYKKLEAISPWDHRYPLVALRLRRPDERSTIAATPPPSPRAAELVKNKKFFVKMFRVEETLDLAERMEENLEEICLRRPIGLFSFKGAFEDLKALHLDGGVHRDLKPSNLLMKAGKVHIGDLDSLNAVDELHVCNTDPELHETKYALFAELETKDANEILASYCRDYGQHVDNRALLLTLMCVTRRTPAHLIDRPIRLKGEAAQAARGLEKARAGGAGRNQAITGDLLRDRLDSAFDTLMHGTVHERSDRATVLAWLRRHVLPEARTSALCLLLEPRGFGDFCMTAPDHPQNLADMIDMGRGHG